MTYRPWQMTGRPVCDLVSPQLRTYCGLQFHTEECCFYCHHVLWYQLHTGAEAHALILVGCRVLTPSRSTTPRFALFRQPPTILGHYSCQKPSIMAVDPQCIVSSMVEVKACHVMNLAECLRHYDSNSKTKRFQGIMTHVEVIKNLTTNRMMTFMMAAYNLGGRTIHPCRLNIQSVKAVLTPTAATVTTAGGALLGSTDRDSTATEAMTPPAATEPTL